MLIMEDGSSVEYKKVYEDELSGPGLSEESTEDKEEDRDSHAENEDKPRKK